MGGKDQIPPKHGKLTEPQTEDDRECPEGNQAREAPAGIGRAGQRKDPNLGSTSSRATASTTTI